MADDPAFLFYPGDYLRDTQCLSEAVQVAYDRIICEHMRNICIRQDQLNFFTKRLSESEKTELLMVLKKTDEGYCIPWVAESITKRRSYSQSRRENRAGKSKEHMNNISKTYDSHMDNEIVNENEDINDLDIEKTRVFLKGACQWDLSVLQVKDYWNAFLIHSENEPYQIKGKRKKHFRDWLKKQKPPIYGTYKSASSRKSSGTDQLIESLRQDLQSGT